MLQTKASFREFVGNATLDEMATTVLDSVTEETKQAVSSQALDSLEALQAMWPLGSFIVALTAPLMGIISAKKQSRQ